MARRTGAQVWTTVGVLALTAAAGLAAVGIMLAPQVARRGAATRGPEASSTTVASLHDGAGAVEATAIAALRRRFRDPAAVVVGDVATYRFGPEDERAVCGTVASAPRGEPARFVVRVLLPRSGRVHPGGGGGGPPLAVIEDAPGLSYLPSDAARRYCHDAVVAAAAPSPAVAAAAPETAVAPESEPAMVSPAPGAAMPALSFAGAEPVMARDEVGGGAGGGGGSSGEPVERVVVQSPANMRAEPVGGAPVVRVAPRGESFQVLGRAPGGWVRVGTAADGGEGWIHGSLLGETAP